MTRAPIVLACVLARTGDDRIFIKRKGARLSWRATSPGGTQVGKALLRRA